MLEDLDEQMRALQMRVTIAENLRLNETARADHAEKMVTHLQNEMRLKEEKG
jgi:hypothetical protein